MRRRQRHGGNAIEFAFVMPVLLAVVFGFFDFAVYFTQYQTVVQAVREGARAASVADINGGQDPLAIGEREANRVLAVIGLDNTANCRTVQTGLVVVQCSVDVVFRPIVGYVPGLPDRLARDHSMIVEQTWQGVSVSDS